MTGENEVSGKRWYDKGNSVRKGDSSKGFWGICASAKERGGNKVSNTRGRLVKETVERRTMNKVVGVSSACCEGGLCGGFFRMSHRRRVERSIP